MHKIGNKIFLVILSCSLVVMAVFASLGIHAVFTILKNEAEENLLLQVRNYAQEFSGEFARLEERVQEINSYVQQTLDVRRLVTDRTYLAEYEKQIAPFMEYFALHRSISDASWMYFDPRWSDSPHDVYYVGSNGKMERQKHIPFEYYDNTPVPQDDKEWWYGPVRTGVGFWTNPYNWTLRNGRVIKVASYALPILKDGVLVGVGGSYYPFDTLIQRVADIRVYQSGYASLVNEKMDVIVHPTMFAGTRYTSDNLFTYKGGLYADLARQVRQKPHGVIFYERDGERKIYAYSTLPNGWVLGLHPDMVDVYEQLYVMLRHMAAASVLCLLLATAAAYIMGRSITRPLLKVINAAEIMGKGNLSVRVDVQTKDEIRTLAHALNTMLDNLKNSGERLESIIAGVGMYTWDYDVRTATLQHDGQFCRALELPVPAEGGAKSLHWLQERIHPEDRKKLWLMTDGGSKSNLGNFEFRFLMSSGQWRWFQSLGRVEEVDAEGCPLRLSGAGFDIHDRKKAALSETERKQQLEELVHRRTQELEESRNEALAASKAKSEFLSTVSHELRTPMNAILGFVQLFDRANLTSRQVESLQKIRTSAAALCVIISDVLDISSLEANRLSLEPVPFSPREMLGEVFKKLAVEAEAKGLNSSMKVEDDVPPVLVGDMARLRQIILNLLNNAVKFTPKGTVHLFAGVREFVPGTPPGVRLFFLIRDTGIGMTEEQAARVFQPFTQADNSTTRTYGGIGLGLAICSRLVELMQGQLKVRSAPGRGSEFHFTVVLGVGLGVQPQPVLPLSPLTFMPGQGVSLRALREDCAAKEQGPECGPERETERRQPRVLVVEDNIINQEISRALLEEFGLLVEIAENGREGVDMATARRFDGIFMDMQMPVMDGLEATRTLRALGSAENSAVPWLAQTPIIAMTANALTADRRRCLDAGMDDFLTKPLDVSALEGMLRRRFAWIFEDRTQGDAP